jgi:energy-coupling factor transporter transmembrane protein EcfT
MAQLTTLGFSAGTSFLHRWDPRFKLAAVAAVGLSCLDATPAGLAVGTLSVMLAASRSGVAPMRLARELRYLLLFLAAIFAVRALLAGPPYLVEGLGIGLSREGALEGLLVGWRLLLVALMGLLVTVTTAPAGVKAAMEWFLAPVPFLPHRRIGTMMGLVLRFLPELYLQAGTVMDAQRARCIEARKNPIRRTVALAIPYLRRTFLRADTLALAMEARCYNENRTRYPLTARRPDWIGAVVVALLCVLLLKI